MKNIGPREGGSITAAQFLKRFVDEGVAWAHLDIAGMAWADKDGPVYAKGATGYGVRLLDRYIAAKHEGDAHWLVIATPAKAGGSNPGRFTRALDRRVVSLLAMTRLI